MSTDACGCLGVWLKGNERLPNMGLQLTATSVRSYVAPASGSS